MPSTQPAPAIMKIDLDIGCAPRMASATQKYYPASEKEKKTKNRHDHATIGGLSAKFFIRFHHVHDLADFKTVRILLLTGVGYLQGLRAQRHRGDPPARELLERVRRACVAALRHQDFPFKKVVEAVAPRRDLTGSPLFQVMFAFDNTPPPRLDLPGAAVETVAMGNPLTRFDITLALTERDGRIEGLCEFDADLL